MSSKLFQGLIYQMKEAIGRTVGVLDDKGVIIACSALAKMGESHKEALEEVSYSFDTVTLEGYTYKPVGTHARIDYIVFAEGTDEKAANAVAMLSVTLASIKTLYDEKYDKANFIKNIILDNILPSDIYIKSKELHFDAETPRLVYLARFAGDNEGSTLPFDIVQNLFPDKTKDYVINVGENDIVLVKELRSATDIRNIDNYAKMIVNTAETEFMVKATVGIGTVVNTVKDLARSFKDAQVALEVGKVFDTEKSTINYETLGIGRLIYQLPTTLCEMFLQEVFKEGAFEALDQETLITIQTFFENNLNVSETSRKLFVHRNTLVYRLEKIKKVTGLDLREFDNAITFKVALMVKKYVTSKPMIY